jgi:hypothetical protein
VTAGATALLGAGRAPSAWRRELARTHRRLGVLTRASQWVRELFGVLPVLWDEPLFGRLLESIVADDTSAQQTDRSDHSSWSRHHRPMMSRPRPPRGPLTVEPAPRVGARAIDRTERRSRSTAVTLPLPAKSPSMLQRQAPPGLLQRLASIGSEPRKSVGAGRSLKRLEVQARPRSRIEAAQPRDLAAVSPTPSAYSEALIRRASGLIHVDPQPATTRAHDPETQSRAQILNRDDGEEHGSHAGRVSLKTQWASSLSGEQAPISLLMGWREASNPLLAKSSDPRSTAPDPVLRVEGRGHQDRAVMTRHSSPSRTDQPPPAVLIDQRSVAVGPAPAVEAFRAPGDTESDDGVETAALIGADDLLPLAPADGRLGRELQPRSFMPRSPAFAASMLRGVPELDNAAAREQLAEAMRRILTNEARRHGIDV